jgi:colicin import membrane protein
MRLSALSLLTLLVAFRAAAAEPDLNRLTRIDVADRGGAVTVTIEGSKPPSFTTFPLDDPPRFVIDFSDATLVKVPEDIPVRDGTVHRVKAVNYPGEGTSIARVMIAFERPVDPPDMQATGNAVVVRIAKPASARAPAAAAPDAAKAQADASAAAAAAAKAKAQEDARAQAEAAAKASAAQEAEARAHAEEVARQERENEEAKAWKASRRAESADKADDGKVRVTRLDEAAAAEAERRSAAEAEARRNAEDEARLRVARAREARARELGLPSPEAEARKKAEARARAEADAKARAEAEARAQAAAEAKARADDEAAAKKRAEAEARLAAEREAAERARAAKEAQVAAQRQAVERAREAKLAARREAAERARAAKEAKLAARREAARRATAAKEAKLAAQREAAERAKAAKEAKLAAKRGAAQRATAAKQAKLASARQRERPSEVRELGFKQIAKGSRVFVRTSSAPRFTIGDAGERVILVELQNTRISRTNDARLLDTTFFPSAVAKVTPRRRGTSTVLEIALRERVSYQQRVEGDVLAIDFEQPGPERVLPAGAAPAAAEAAAERDAR